MTIKTALYRELKYNLCGSGGALYGLVSSSRVKLDMRTNVDRTEANYPWIIFRRVTEGENNFVEYAGERFEIEIIGLRSSATKGDTLLEQIKDAIKDHFKGTHKTIGKYTANGTADPTGGLKVRARYFDTVEGFDETLEEKAHIMIFFFTYIRS